MNQEEIKEILYQQLQLLAEASKKETDPDNLCEMTEYMLRLADRVDQRVSLKEKGQIVSGTPERKEAINQLLAEQMKLLSAMSEKAENPDILCELTQWMVIAYRQIQSEYFNYERSDGGGGGV